LRSLVTIFGYFAGVAVTPEPLAPLRRATEDAAGATGWSWWFVFIASSIILSAVLSSTHCSRASMVCARCRP